MNFKIILLILCLILVLIFLIISYSNIPWQISAPIKDPEKAKKNGQELLAKSGRVLALAAHPDDLEYWVAGTLGKIIQKGGEVIIVVATTHKQEGKERKVEQKRAAEIMGYQKVVFLDLPDRELINFKNELKNKINNLINKENPQIIFVFDWEKEGRFYHHPDHQILGQVVLEIKKESKSSFLPYFYHTREPDTLVDVTEIIDKKVEAFNAHKSQMHNFFSEDNRLKHLKRISSYYGSLIDVKYAEPLRKGW